MSDVHNMEIAVIEDRMRSDRAGYIRDEGMQSRYRDLLDARESGGAPAPAQSRGRIAEIEAIMKNDRRAYFKNEALQAEYRALLEAANPGGDRAEERPAVARLIAPAAGPAEARQMLELD